LADRQVANAGLFQDLEFGVGGELPPSRSGVGGVGVIGPVCPTSQWSVHPVYPIYDQMLAQSSDPSGNLVD